MKHFSTREVARILEADEAQVRSWASLGRIEAHSGADGAPEYTFQQLLQLKTTKGLVAAGVSASRVRRIWSSLRRQLPDDVPLTSVTVFAEGDRAVASDGQSRWRPESGQFLLDLDAAAQSGIALEIATDQDADPPLDPEPNTPPDTCPGACEPTPSLNWPRGQLEHPAPDSAEHWFEMGSELETSSPLEARAAYARALELDPNLADAHLNLGRLEHAAGELGKAEVHYREAVRCAPDDATSHFNLGVLLEDRNRPDEAIHAYEQAIIRDPDTADAHYNLGLLLEGMRRRSEAMKHLMIARRLYGEDGEG